ncbi:MAG: aminotransferase class V-fold PLP-dependent enzyme [Bacteroidota bacterium]
MIYLNNAGTSWPKPKEVHTAISEFGKLDPGEWHNVFEKGLETVTAFFDINSKDRFLFTSSCTSSLAIALSDFPWNKGDRILISSMEHHALSRWYHKLIREQGLEGTVIPRAKNGPFDLDLFEKELKKGIRLVAVTMASNVTGEFLPYEEILRMSHQYGAKCLLDGAQVAGLYPIDINKLNPDFFVFAGHKGTLGPQGIGGLYISDSVSMVCPSAICHITSRIKSAIMPSYCDTGSANMAAIAGLTAGIQWIRQKGFDQLINHRTHLRLRLQKGLENLNEVEILGNQKDNLTTGAISIQLKHSNPTIIGQKLWDGFTIKAGAGFQCAPMAHEALGTHERGVLRFSVGVFNKESEIDQVLSNLIRTT